MTKKTPRNQLTFREEGFLDSTFVWVPGASSLGGWSTVPLIRVFDESRRIEAERPWASRPSILLKVSITGNEARNEASSNMTILVLC